MTRQTPSTCKSGKTRQSAAPANLPAPEVIAAEIVEDLQAALTEASAP